VDPVALRAWRVHLPEPDRRAAVDRARLAAELGYADQAQFTRDFTAMVGESPTRYAERYPTRSAAPTVTRGRPTIVR
jgi:AraC-like DNA-binding protein